MAAVPRLTTLRGRHVTVRPLAVDDADALFEAGRDERIWTYLYDGPYPDVASMRAQLEWAAASEDPLFFALVVDGEPRGVASYMRFEPEHGAIEIGHIWLGAGLARTTAATEAIYLMARHAFDDLGYRRVEWKCNAENAASRRAAERFGFTFEGVFRKHMIVKGRNRDTAWYAIVDDDWPPIREAFERWLDPGNFDEDGRQRATLESLR